MSLLLDARRKSQQAHLAEDGAQNRSELELKQDEHPAQASSGSGAARSADSRSAGQNLFGAKSRILPGIHRNLLLALGGTVLLLAAGAAYLWHLGSAGNTRLPQHDISAAPTAAAPQPAPATVETAPLIAKIAASGIADSGAAMSQPLAAAESAPSPESRIRIEPQRTEPIDPLLANAYQAYRNDKLDESQQLYREMLGKDAHNTDALLGLAAIAQQHGEEARAAQYYSRVLQLDPRNAAANAGMSALTTDDNKESRLKTLLNEQNNAAVLHFALGNLYAEQSRWGEAQQAYFNACTLEPDNAEYVFNLAVSLDHLGQGKLAAQHYQRALQLDRTHEFDHPQIKQHVQALTR